VDPEDNFFKSLLLLFSQTSFKRNYLWKKELEEFLSEDVLVKNIWKINGILDIQNVV
jgi:hypothetical protein